MKTFRQFNEASMIGRAKRAAGNASSAHREAPDEAVRKRPGDWRPTRLPMSTHSHGLLLDKFNNHPNPRMQEVPHDKLRATQDWVHSDYSGGEHGHHVYGPPYGVRTKNGEVHVLDGHHRADHAFGEKKPLKMVVADI